MTILVTGGAGFIGSNFVTAWIQSNGSPVVNLDKLTYAGNLANLAAVVDDARHVFVHGDICDEGLVRSLLLRYQPCAIVHLAAESHVDRSIQEPGAFVRTNIDGTFALLQATREFWTSLTADRRASFRFLHVSTDEVFGPLEPGAPPFRESSAYAPSSPYAASKAASDHLVRACHRTYGLPILVAHCCNNYGPLQFPEKLIPRMVASALRGEDLPLYGDGEQTRDWIHVEDNCAALRSILEHGIPGESYNVGGHCELSNIRLVTQICSILDRLRPRSDGAYRELVRHVADRPGHDRRYALDTGKLVLLCGWRPRFTIGQRLEATVQWYLDNSQWLAAASS